MRDFEPGPVETPLLDLRSDVVTPPTDEMWDAMRRAKLGWNLLGEDPSVNQLEALAAELLGKEAAVFLPTCSMANLIALMTLGERGSQVVLESTAHPVVSEEWGLAYVCGLFPRLVHGEKGVLYPDTVEEAITNSPVSHPPRTSVVCLENSHNNGGGTAITAEQTAAVAEVARRHGASVHLDGARLFNSAAALGVPAKGLAETVDTVAISLNKGLSAPEGALLCGSRRTIDAARINAKRIGAASIHKAGIFAAAGIVALTRMVGSPANDNRRAADLARKLARLPGLRIDLNTVQTNIIVADTAPAELLANEFARRVADHGVLVNARYGYRVRFVTHRLVGDAEVVRAANAVATVLSGVSSRV